MDTTDLVRTLTLCTKRIEAGHVLAPSKLATILLALTEYEVAPGGPYAYTAHGGEHEIDVGFNLVIARFLAVCQITLPNLDLYIRQSLDRGLPRSTLIDEDDLKILTEHFLSAEEIPVENLYLSEPNEDEHMMMERIRHLFTERIRTLAKGMQENAVAAFESVRTLDSDRQISLIALYVRDALGAAGKSVHNEVIAELGLANTLFWAASRIYDDFWDEDESADPRLLPVANLFARHYVDCYRTLLSERSGFPSYFHAMMDKLDNANAWETQYCRMKKKGPVLILPEEVPAYETYEIKFYPAAGHLMGPIALLIKAGFDLTSPEIGSLIRYFKHMLIARQLNDDLHDWKEDFTRGHISTVVAALLIEWKREHPESGTVHSISDMPELESLFWFSVVEPICRSVLAHSRKSRTALRTVPFVSHQERFERFIVRNEDVAKRTIRECEISRELINSFRIS